MEQDNEETFGESKTAPLSSSRGKKLDFSATQGNIFDATIHNAVVTKFGTETSWNLYKNNKQISDFGLSSLEDEPKSSTHTLYINLPQTSEEYWKDVKHQ